MLHAVILAGGSGTRLWPLSRTHYPKQFLQLLGEHTLLQQTVLRLDNLIPPERIWIVTGSDQAHIVRSQLASLLGLDEDKVHILAEPLPKNTAAAIGLAAIHAQRQDSEAMLVVLPADHWIERQNAFGSLLDGAAKLAQHGVLVTLGIVPDYPATGYGYICRGAPVVVLRESLPERLVAYKVRLVAYKVRQFVEKPDLPTAREYLLSDTYYWNAGIFLWKASTILEEIALYLPLLAQGLEEIGQCLDNDTTEQTPAVVYSKLEAVSIDCGILEKSARLIVVPADIGWSDLGDWMTIHRLSPKDARGNVLSPNVLDIGSENSFVYSNRRKIATIGLKNTVVVDAEDALLICPIDRTEEVRTIAHRLRADGEEVAHVSRTVHRPWGTYTVLEEGAGFKVKRLVVHPGAALSLQLHRYRSEHWVVVSGVAQVTNGDLECQLHVEQSTYVPQGTVHRITNPGSELLEIIEVQTGPYLGEDDIVRFADLYQRVAPRGVF